MENCIKILEEIDLGSERILKIIDGEYGRYIRVTTTHKSIIYESKVIDDENEMENHINLLKRIYS